MQVDSGRLERATLNLLTNAITHAPDTPHRRPRGARRRVGYGSGIAPEVLPAIFTRCYQGGAAQRREHHGLGLGLFITCEIVVAHGGAIDVAPTPRQGSTFTIRLPVAEP